MAYRFTLFAVISLLFPVKLFAQWYEFSDKDPTYGGNTYAAKIDKMALRGIEEKKIKARISLVIACNAEWPETYLVAIFFDTIPVFEIAEDKELPMKSIPTLASFYTSGSDKQKMILTEVTQWLKTPKQLIFKPEFPKKILQDNLLFLHEFLTIGFIPTWDDEVMSVRIPLEGAITAIKGVKDKCNAEKH